MRKRKTRKPTVRRDTTARKKKNAPKKQPKAPRVPKTRNAGTMTEAQYFQKLRHALRNAFRWWKPMQQALKAASRPSQSKNKRLKTEYQCAKCQGWFKRTEVQIDHIIPCGSLKSYDDLVPFIKNLTQEESSSYQILCKLDHKAKTDEERAASKCQTI
jgi:hypothetical protein